MREKLIELLADSEYLSYEEKADYLIANGVTIAKWIPVTERLPEEYEHILVCYDDGWICDQHSPVDGGVTHWMPLPEPPKGE